jgi:hypothetical protein
LSKKKVKTETFDDGLENGPSPVATGEVALPPSADPSVDALEPPPLPDAPPPLPDPLPEEVSVPVAPPVAEAHFVPQLVQLVPVAQPVAPSASLVVTAPDPALEERLRRLEAMLEQAQQNLRVAEQNRITERTQTSSPLPSSGPSMLGQARALLDVGRHLLPALPGGQGAPKAKGWLIWEMIAELRAMVCMYLDPRYRVPWYGYVVPPALFAAFLFTKYWFPFALVLEKANLEFLVVVPVDLLLLYSMFKVLGHEARRYRETAPDLPPSLRL